MFRPSLYHIIQHKHKLFSTSPRQIALLEEQILDKLQLIVDENLEKNLVSLGRIKNIQVHSKEKHVQFDIEVPTVALEDQYQWKTQAEKVVQELPWVSSVKVHLTSPRPRSSSAKNNSSLARVSNVIAVYSCKGGVGKSTIAVNLAYRLKAMGAKVGLLDADLYGPSLPTMISPDDVQVRKSKTITNFIEPIVYDGIRCMSFGYVNTKAAPGAGGKGAAILRGPMATRLIDQLIQGTHWGELDYLVVDMPPGTGDIQISLSQQMAITAAVIVTTPQKLSFIDVVKGIEMFQSLKIPIAAVVENMKYFDCVHGHRHYPFGDGHIKQLIQEYNLSNTFELPILKEIAQCSDTGSPYVRKHSNDQVANIIGSLTSKVVKEIVKLRHYATEAPILTFDSNRGIVIRCFRDGSAQEAIITPQELLQQCRCAKCIDELTGVKIAVSDNLPENLQPQSIHQKGNYAYAIEWNNGHRSLYTFDQFQTILFRNSQVSV